MPETNINFIKQTQNDIRYCDTLIMHNYYMLSYQLGHNCQPPKTISLILGAIFLAFQKKIWFLILTIIDYYKSLLFLVLFITACYNDVSLHELHHRRQKSHNDKLYSYYTNVQVSCHFLCVCRGLLTGGSTRELLSLLKVNVESLKAGISSFRILSHVLQCSLNSVSTYYFWSVACSHVHEG